MKKHFEKVKYLTLGLIIGVFLAGGATYAASDYILSLFQAKIVVDGEEKQGSDKPFQYYNGQFYVPTSLIYNGTTYVPLRFFSESLGQAVKYEGTSKTIYVGKIPSGEAISQYMSDIIESFYQDQYTSYTMNESMKMGGKEYKKGYSFYNFMNKKGHLSFNLEGKYTNINGTLGLTDGYNQSDATVEFYGDDKLLGTFDLEAGSLTKNINLDVTGVIKMDIKFSSSSNWSNYPMINFVNPIIK